MSERVSERMVGIAVILSLKCVCDHAGHFMLIAMLFSVYYTLSHETRLSLHHPIRPSRGRMKRMMMNLDSTTEPTIILRIALAGTSGIPTGGSSSRGKLLHTNSEFLYLRLKSSLESLAYPEFERM